MIRVRGGGGCVQSMSRVTVGPSSASVSPGSVVMMIMDGREDLFLAKLNSAVGRILAAPHGSTGTKSSQYSSLSDSGK